MSKTIQINPDLFRLSTKGRKSHNKTEKTRDGSGGGDGIRVKSPRKERSKSNKTIRNNLLSIIRRKQQDSFKELLKNDKNIVDKQSIDSEFQSDFDDSLKFLMQVAKQAEPAAAQTPLNHTFRRPPTAINPTIIGTSSESVLAFPDLVDIGLPDSLNSTEPSAYKGDAIVYSYGENPPIAAAVPLMKLLPPPAYGCLKGGQLPTYRNYQNMTQKIRPPPLPVHNASPMQNQYSTDLPLKPQYLPSPPPMSIQGGGLPPPPPSDPTTFTQDILEEARRKSREKARRVVSEIKTAAEKKDVQKKRSNLRYLKQRKTIRRTYNVGKSRFQPKIGVLISNRTIRNNITTKAQMLKQTPITEVRAYLVKKGFIKVGTAAPNDVLRKMYESAALICGDVENHNSENLLYNYFNDKA
jgi:hypothetical protein